MEALGKPSFNPYGAIKTTQFSVQESVEDVSHQILCYTLSLFDTWNDDVLGEHNSSDLAIIICADCDGKHILSNLI